MLKNKKAIYLLIPLNLFIWGFFVYRFYSAFTEAEVPLSSSGAVSVKIADLKDSISYTLKLDYKDPFLKESKKEHLSEQSHYNGINTDRQPKKPMQVKTPVIPVVKQLPEIKYLGLIKNSSSGLATALISVNGQSRLIKQNDAVDGIVFKSFNRDSLVAKYGKERIVARK